MLGCNSSCGSRLSCSGSYQALNLTVMPSSPLYKGRNIWIFKFPSAILIALLYDTLSGSVIEKAARWRELWGSWSCMQQGEGSYCMRAQDVFIRAMKQ